VFWTILIEVILELEFHIRHSSIPSLLNSRTNENVGKKHSNRRKEGGKRSG
jgi:hypothetical protein